MANGRARAGIRILLAEGRAASLERLRSSVAGNPCVRVVGEARTTAEAMKLALALAPDAILLGPTMPSLGPLRGRRAAGKARIVVLQGPGDEADQGPAPPEDELTARERQVLGLVVAGLASKAIAERLGIGVRTVETHRERLMGKLGVRNAAGLVRYALEKGLVN